MVSISERRERVMRRSRTLGHCVCNPMQPCPCPGLIDSNVCSCAGERLPRKDGGGLMRHVRKAGCASKIGQGELLEILAGLPPVEDPNVLVGAAAGDDAGVYRIHDGLALVQTVDVFTPCVDDPYLFGQIAAANSLSDVYAMGGTPLTALSIVGFPIESLDGALMQAMLRGGMDKLAEAGCALIGGHSIQDEEVKCGFAITGVIDPKRVVVRDRAEIGDVLVLTKPLGTGIVSFAAQLGLVDASCLAEAGAWMAVLNKDAAERMLAYDAHACTDVTGFGLAGHLAAMARGSGVSVELELSEIPVLAAAAACLRRGVFGGGVDRNQAYASRWVRAEDADPEDLLVLYDPQTSGGLLVALPEARAALFVGDMQARGHAATAIVGRVTARAAADDEGCVLVRGAGLRRLIGTSVAVGDPKSGDEPTCCDAAPTLSIGKTSDITNKEETDVDALAMFRDFMKEANNPGLIDARNKKLMAVALSIAQRCHPCLKIHLQGARKMGLTKQEIDEAASLAIAFGGCTAMMFYKEVCQELDFE